jgi:inosine/guanosine/xanthosine phosphorylase family protein
MEELRDRAELAVVLGSGLGAFEKLVDIDRKVPYRAFDGLGDPTVEGHRGRVILGRLGGRPLILFSGRFHCYEGLSLEEAGLPARIASELGCKRLLLTQAAGSLRRDLAVGSWMLATDIVSLPRRPITHGPGEGAGLVLISDTFRREIIDAARRRRARLREGILFWTTGPCYETPAESLVAVELGASAASMSGLPELAVARAVGLEAAVLSLITNHVPSVSGRGVEHGGVLRAGEKGVLTLGEIVAGLLCVGGW